MLALLALGLLAEPAIALDAEGELAGAVGARLLEEGYRLVPAANSADVRLALNATTAGVRLIASAPPWDQQAWVEAGPAGAVRLEILQRAVLLVRAVPISSPLPRDRSAALILDGPAAPELRADLTARILAAGVPIAASAAPGDRVLCATIGEREAAFAVIDAGSGCPAERARRQRDPTEQWIAGAIGLLIAVPEPPPPPPIAAADPLLLTIRILGGAALRSGGVDPTIGLGADYGYPNGFGASFQARGIRSSGDRSLGVTELSFTAGPRLTWALDERWSIGAGVSAGALLHQWSLSSGGTGLLLPSGVHTDLLVELPLRAGFRIVGATAIELTLTPGLAGGGRRHQLGDQTLWSRSAFQLVAALGIGGSFGGGNRIGAGE